MTRALILTWEYPPLIEGGLARVVRHRPRGWFSSGSRST